MHCFGHKSARDCMCPSAHRRSEQTAHAGHHAGIDDGTFNAEFAAYYLASELCCIFHITHIACD